MQKQPAPGALGQKAVLDHHVTLPVLGKPISFRTNHPDILHHVRQRFGHWAGFAEADDHPAPDPLTLDLVVHGDRRTCAPISDPNAIFHRYHGGVYLAGMGDTLLSAHQDAGRAIGFINPGLLDRPLVLGIQVIDCLALLLATRYQRTAVHAAALVRNGKAVVLIGNSGAGKSTLSYAGLKAGYSLLSEDTIYLQTEPKPVVWGNPRALHLGAQAVELFPEIGAFEVVSLPSGKKKRVLPLDDNSVSLQAEAFVVCILEPHHDVPNSELTPASAAVVRRKLLEIANEPGFDLDVEASNYAADILAQGGGYHFKVGHDTQEAIRALDRLW